MSKSTKAKLPEEPSALIRLALADLKKVERDKAHYVVNMNMYHEPDDFQYRKRKCTVCFAGAVMAGTLRASPGWSLDPSDFDTDTKKKLIALDYFRSGRVRQGLLLLSDSYRYIEPGLADFLVVPYRDDPKGFRVDMERMAAHLERRGL